MFIVLFLGTISCNGTSCFNGGEGRVCFWDGGQGSGVRPKWRFKKNRWMGTPAPHPLPIMGNLDIYTHCFVFLVSEWSYGVFIHFTLVHINLGFMSYHFVHMVVFNQLFVNNYRTLAAWINHVGHINLWKRPKRIVTFKGEVLNCYPAF